MIVSQSQEEREAKVDKVYLGNVKVVWGNGMMPDPAPLTPRPEVKQEKEEEPDLPF